MASPLPAYSKSSPLPSNLRIQKRPLLHPPILAPKATSQARIVYVSARTPFISAVKRVQTFLNGNGDVTLKASGKAIDIALQIGLYFQGEGEGVVIRTGSIDVVDDVIAVDPEGVEEGEGGVRRRGKRKRGEEDVEMEEESTEVSMRTRKVSTVEIDISVINRCNDL